MQKVRIVVADPLELVYEGVRNWLAAEKDLEVVAHVPSGDRLLELLPSMQAGVLLLEVSMPGKDGIDSARAVHKLLPEVKMIAHSALTDIEYVNSMLIEGCSGYVMKGCPREELVAAIRTVLAGGRHLSPQAQASVDAGYRYTAKRFDGEYVGLTLREKEVIRLIAMERTNEEIGALLHMSAETVKTHRKRIMGKLNVRSIAGLAKYAVDRRWI
jgi:DNA-binding NarL/FixJ family response regulator